MAQPTQNGERRDRWISDDDVRRFADGTHERLFEILGAHPAGEADRRGTRFAVWAPNARSASVIGSFNDWDPKRHPMTPIEGAGIWTAFVEGVGPGAQYKFHLVSHVDDYTVDKTDPFAFHRQQPPETASIVHALDYAWDDAAWLERRRAEPAAGRAMSIYEVHLGSWRRDPERPERWLDYDELGDALVPYLESTGFTHVEFLPPMEHPYYASWGYQTTGYFAATSRYGTPQQLMRLIDRLHQAGIGVVLDWVPSHFPSDEHGLAFFDGTHLFEHEDPRQGFHPDWNSHIFNYGRNTVRSFLVSSAMFWIERYHVDAIRFDAVASMLYLDYSRAEGQWVPNRYGGRENLEAIAFLRQLNEAVHERHPGVLTIAEESTAWPMVSRPAYLGGLGFDMKWDMGWMNDTLRYMALDPVHRKFNHDKITFRAIYAWSENFLLPLSHDEVVHGKGSLLGKMSGDTWQKFANLRALYGYMYGLPGKKLLFMGSELGPWREWDHESGLEWELLEHEHHAGLQRWVGELNRLYRETVALHAADFDPRGFAWIDCHDSDQSVVVFRRSALGDDASPGVVVACNFTPVPRHDYRIGLPVGGRWAERLTSDDTRFWGGGLVNADPLEAVPMTYHGQPFSTMLTLPPLSTVFLEQIEEVEPIPGATGVPAEDS